MQATKIVSSNESKWFLYDLQTKKNDETNSSSITQRVKDDQLQMPYESAIASKVASPVGLEATIEQTVQRIMNYKSAPPTEKSHASTSSGFEQSIQYLVQQSVDSTIASKVALPSAGFESTIEQTVQRTMSDKSAPPTEKSHAISSSGSKMVTETAPSAFNLSIESIVQRIVDKAVEKKVTL